MCRWIAYKGRPIFLETLVYEPIHSLVDQSRDAHHGKSAINADGFGVGWYGDRAEPGVYRDILPAWSDPNLKSLARTVRSGLFFAHVRASTGTATSRPNCHPFAYGRWMMMHNGRIHDYERLRRPIDGRLDDAHYTARSGTTDSEALFYLMLTLGLDGADPAGAIRAAAAEIEALGRSLGRERTLTATAAISDGRRLYALRTHPVDGPPPSLFHREEARDLTVVSEPLDGDDAAWRELPPGHLLIAEPDGPVRIEEF